MFTSLVLSNSIYHRQLILRTIYDSIHIIHVILISPLKLLFTFNIIFFNIHVDVLLV